jgi:hypothetical protein
VPSDAPIGLTSCLKWHSRHWEGKPNRPFDPSG